MNKVVALVLVLLLRLHAATESRTLTGTDQDLNSTDGKFLGIQNGAYDHYKMVHQWSRGFCNSKKNKCLVAPLPNVFTVHGLWPGNMTTMIVAPQCTGGKPRSWSPVNNPALLTQLQRDWPDLLSRTPSQGFWKHEWDEHGQCSTYDQAGYISQTMKLYAQLNLKDRLAKSVQKISPGPVPIAFAVLENAVKGITGKIPDLLCDACDLVEIRICYDTGFKIIDCPPMQLDPRPPKPKTKYLSASCKQCAAKKITYRA